MSKTHQLFPSIELLIWKWDAWGSSVAEDVLVMQEILGSIPSSPLKGSQVKGDMKDQRGYNDTMASSS